jgi:hypothetical protein
MLPPSVSLLSRQGGILNIPQPYRPPKPVAEIAILLYFTFYHEAHYDMLPRRALLSRGYRFAACRGNLEVAARNKVPRLHAACAFARNCCSGMNLLAPSAFAVAFSLVWYSLSS